MVLFGPGGGEGLTDATSNDGRESAVWPRAAATYRSATGTVAIILLTEIMLKK
jgi:hypothetical protein